MPPSRRAAVFRAAAAAFVVTACVHAVRAFDSEPTRHALFVLVNLACVAGVLRRPRWFPLPFALLVLQQLGSHGGRAWSALQAGAPPGGEDVAVVLFMPALLGLLVWDAARPGAGATTDPTGRARARRLRHKVTPSTRCSVRWWE